MKKIFLVFVIFMVTSVAYSHEDSKEYRVVCKRTEGCPVINGTCPTCTIVDGIPKTITDEEIAEWGGRMQERNKYVPLGNDSPRREPSGWGWDGPTWNGLWVLY